MGPNLKELQIRIVAKKEFHSAVQFSAEPCWTCLQCTAPDVHTAINTANPILGPCPPILCWCLTGQLPISWMVSTNMFFPWWPLGWVCFQRWRGRRSWSERTGDQELPPRDLYTSPKHSWERAMPHRHHGHPSFKGQSMGTHGMIRGWEAPKVKPVRMASWVKGARCCWLRKLHLQRSHVSWRLVPYSVAAILSPRWSRLAPIWPSRSDVGGFRIIPHTCYNATYATYIWILIQATYAPIRFNYSRVML